MIINKPDLRWNGELTDTGKIIKILQHHVAHRSWDFFDVHKYHRDGKGWFGIGYNWWIGFDGEIFEGRGRKQGAHAGPEWNSKSYGIAYQGHFNYQKMTDEQVASGAWLNAKLIKEEGLHLRDIIGHGAVVSTECPGRNFRMTELKEETKRIIEGEDIMEYAILINTFADFPAVEPISERLNAPIYLRKGFNPEQKINKLYVAGGGEGDLDLKNVDKVVDLSGEHRWDTAGNLKVVWEDLK